MFVKRNYMLGKRKMKMKEVARPNVTLFNPSTVQTLHGGVQTDEACCNQNMQRNKEKQERRKERETKRERNTLAHTYVQ